MTALKPSSTNHTYFGSARDEEVNQNAVLTSYANYQTDYTFGHIFWRSNKQIWNQVYNA